jgi:ligand-binding sensor domain-containing protein/signal transduction histidine kinase
VSKREQTISPKLSRLLLLACVLACACAARAQQLPVRTYTTADGLAHDQVDKVVQDSRGFLWFCTVDGLSRFDGYRFTNYGVKDGLPLAPVNDLLEARDGVYWVAINGGGVSRFDPRRDARRVAEARAGQQAEGDTGRIFTTYRVGEEAQSNIVQTVSEDAAGNIWAGTQGGLFRLEGGREGGTFERVPLNIPGRAEQVIEIESFAQDAEGSIWIGTILGLVRLLPDGRTVHQSVQTSQGTDIAWSLLFDREGRLWVGHQAGLLVVSPEPAARVEDGDEARLWRVTTNSPNSRDGRLLLPNAPGEARWYTTADGLGHNNVQTVRQFSDGRVWVGTRGGGVSVFEAGRFRTYGAAHGLNDRVNSLAEDRDGNVWVGTQASGALKITRGGFISYTEAEGLGSADVLSIFEGSEGRLCVVTSKWTINWLDGEKFRHVRLNLPRRIIDASSGRWQVIRDHEGEWWAATGEGLYRFPSVARLEDLATAAPVAVYTTRDGLADDNISRLFEDSRGDIWIGSYNPPLMLTRWERASGTFRRYAEADGMPVFNWPNVFGEDASGQLWMGLHNGGLARLRDGRVEVFGESARVPGGFGQGLYTDRKGHLWVATSRGGVRLDDPSGADPRVVSFARAGELSSDNLRCFAEDDFGWLYVGTARGVDRIDPSTGRVEHYTTADGLIKSEVMVAFHARAGALWFGTREGLSRLIPAPAHAQAPPPVLISGLRVAGVAQAVSNLGEAEVPLLSLGPEQGQVQVDFFGLSFSAGEDLRYQYMIEGLSREWSTPTDQRTVTASLSPGKYRFLVRAISSDGSTSARPAVVTLNVMPPLWRRWWFVTLAALGVAAAIFAADRSRVHRVVELERVRTRIATDLHDDIGASLSQIAILSEVVNARVGGDSDSPVKEPLSTIANTSREMVDSMSDIVWAINPKRDRLSDLAQRMRLFASDLLSARDIRFQFRAPDAGRDVTVGADLRREIYLIFKETVNNLAKHSGANSAEIDFRLAGSRLVVRVSDDGRGFVAADAAQGNGHGTMGGHGLHSMRKRAEHLGGTYEISSASGRGTTVTLNVPIKIKRRRRAPDWRKFLPKRLLHR